MSLSDRRRFLLLPLALAACGFTPVYAPGRNGAGLYGQVRVAAPDDRASFLLVQNLEQQLGRSGAPRYDLSFDLRVFDEGQAVTAAGDITRYSIVGRADFVLTGIESAAVVVSGQVENFTGYSATGSTVETLAAERDARERLMVILAEQIATQLVTLAEVPG
jgi:LPS-assembly lipoprotein